MKRALPIVIIVGVLGATLSSIWYLEGAYRDYYAQQYGVEAGKV